MRMKQRQNSCCFGVLWLSGKKMDGKNNRSKRLNQPPHIFAKNCLGHFRRDSETVPEYSPAVMSTLSIQLPDSIRQRVEVLAHEDGVGVDAFVATMLSQRIAVVEADSYVRRSRQC